MQAIQSIDITQKTDISIDTLLDGKFYLIIKNGQPVAEINPVMKKAIGFHRHRNKIKLKGNISTTNIIRQERDEK